MRPLLLLCLGLSHLRAQEVAHPSAMVPLSTTGAFVISTRKPPGAAPNAQPEVYEIITGKDGEATLTLGALGSVKLEKETQVRLPAATTPQSLEMLKGKLFFDINAAEIKKNQNAEFRLKTPASLLAVKGTQFFVESGGGQDVVGVHEGSAAIATLAVRSTALLQKGQASTHGLSQPVRPRPMNADELARASLYASMLPVKTAALALVSNGTTDLAEYRLKGDVATVATADAETLASLGPTIMIRADPPGAARLELTANGEVRVLSADTPLKLQMVARQPGTSQASALRFYARARADHRLAMEGRPVPGPSPAGRPAAAQGQPAPWNDCLLDLRARTGSAQTVILELTRGTTTKPDETKSKRDTAHPLLELGDFTFLGAPSTAP